MSAVLLLVAPSFAAPAIAAPPQEFSRLTEPNFAVDLSPGVRLAGRFGDIAGDAALDAVVVTSANTTTGTLAARVHGVLQAGSTRFETVLGVGLDPLLKLGADPTIELGDVDGDGRLDVVLALEGKLPGSVGLDLVLGGDGAGEFPTVLAALDHAAAGLPASADLALVDLDGDGDLDLMSNGRASRNLSRELWLDSAASIGKPLSLQLRATAGSPYALFYASAQGFMPIAGLGVLRLDLATLLFLATGSVDAAGAALLQVQVPPTPALVGLTFFAQAALDAPLSLSRIVGLTLDGN